MSKYDFYVAGPFFNDEQLISLAQIEALLESNNFTMFRPRVDAGMLPKNATKEQLKEVFEADVKAIDSCDFVIADTTYRDTGTSFEIGYAFATNKPVILFCDTACEGKLNLMLAASCFRSFTSHEELNRFLEGFSSGRDAFKGEIE